MWSLRTTSNAEQRGAALPAPLLPSLARVPAAVGGWPAPCTRASTRSTRTQRSSPAIPWPGVDQVYVVWGDA